MKWGHSPFKFPRCVYVLTLGQVWDRKSERGECGLGWNAGISQGWLSFWLCLLAKSDGLLSVWLWAGVNRTWFPVPGVLAGRISKHLCRMEMIGIHWDNGMIQLWNPRPQHDVRHLVQMGKCSDYNCQCALLHSPGTGKCPHQWAWQVASLSE